MKSSKSTLKKLVSHFTIKYFLNQTSSINTIEVPVNNFNFNFKMNKFINETDFTN